MSNPKPERIFMDNWFGKRVLCNTGMHFTRQIETGELYCDRCKTVVADDWDWPWYGFVGNGVLDIAFVVAAAWMYSRGDVLFALVMLAAGVMFATETLTIYYQQQGESA